MACPVRTGERNTSKKMNDSTRFNKYFYLAIVAGGSDETFSFREKTDLFDQEYAMVAENFVREESKLNMGHKLSDGMSSWV